MHENDLRPQTAGPTSANQCRRRNFWEASMTLPRRKFLYLAAGAAAWPITSRRAFAQGYPARPVRMIVPYPPAGPTDLFARLVAQKLSDRFGKQFIVENVPGAGGNIG